MRNIVGMETAPIKTLVHNRGMKLAHVARELGVDKGTITKWSQNRIPAEKVIAFEKVTGISRHDLRPDLYPPASRMDAADSFPASDEAPVVSAAE